MGQIYGKVIKLETPETKCIANEETTRHSTAEGKFLGLLTIYLETEFNPMRML